MKNANAAAKNGVPGKKSVRGSIAKSSERARERQPQGDHCGNPVHRLRTALKELAHGQADSPGDLF
jgi:hypothetical protein